MEKIKYIAIYKNNDVIHDNNIYCVNLNELFIFIEQFICSGWYSSLDEFLEDYDIVTIGYCNVQKLKTNFDNFFEKYNIKK